MHQDFSTKSSQQCLFEIAVLCVGDFLFTLKYICLVHKKMYICITNKQNKVEKINKINLSKKENIFNPYSVIHWVSIEGAQYITVNLINGKFDTQSFDINLN